MFLIVPLEQFSTVNELCPDSTEITVLAALVRYVCWVTAAVRGIFPVVKCPVPGNSQSRVHKLCPFFFAQWYRVL